MKAIKTKLSEVKLNPNNPRLIKDDNFKKLVQSIKDFPEMLDIRPIVVNADMVILGGNMRFKACKEAGLKEVPIIIADNLTEEQQREFLIKDNVSGGEWDWSLLAEWDSEQLEDWGLEIKSFATETDYSEKNKELDLNDFEDQKYTIKLEFTEDDYNLVKERLQELGQTPEKILYDALISL
jgi:ParB-like chromosome segregation protein Spo0J